MAGKAIGKTLDLGYAGGISRAADALVAAYPAKGGDIAFGAPVVLNEDNTVSAVGPGADAPVIGFAVRAVSQPKADAPDGWRYRDGDVVEVLVRGALIVRVRDASDILPRQPVFADAETGEIIAEESDAAQAVEIPGAYFTTGRIGADGVAEVVLTQRLI